MLVIVKSAPESPEGKSGMKLARDMGADLCLIQDAVYFAQEGRILDFPGNIYVLEDDRRLRGLRHDEMCRAMKGIDYDGLIELITKEDKIVGAF